MSEILWLSGLICAISGLFLIAGYLEHRKALLVLDSIIQDSEGKKHEGTDVD